MPKDWMLHVKIALLDSMPEKYIDGSYIEHRICSDEFTPDDINEKFYFLKDVLPGQLSCVWKDTQSKCRLSPGECTTITMMEEALLLHSSFDMINILLIAYFHDLDPIFIRCLPGKIMRNLHRNRTYLVSTWKNIHGQSECYWHSKCKKYLPLQNSDLEMIERELTELSEEQQMIIFNSDDVEQFADYFWKIIELAFGTKIFSLKTFSLEACEKAADSLGVYG